MRNENVRLHPPGEIFDGIYDRTDLANFVYFQTPGAFHPASLRRRYVASYHPAVYGGASACDGRDGPQSA
jgi:hypothetical protein